MDAYYDEAERLDPHRRERELFARLPAFLKKAATVAPALAARLEGVDVDRVTDRSMLTAIPVLRKQELMESQAESPPFGGFADSASLAGRRVYMSPGPIFEVEDEGEDPAQAARAFFATGARRGDIVHNCLAYHMTPGGFLLDAGAKALGCSVFPAGPGNTDMQVEAIAALRPRVYAGTPDFLKVVLDRAAERGTDASSLKLALVTGGALFPSMRAEYRERGVEVFQCYATAEFGVIAYETAGPDGTVNPGMVLNENLIAEVVRPGTGDPVAEGEVGELVVTGFSQLYPMVRIGTGDLTAILPGTSPCGRTNTRIKGWMGRADQRTKIKGMFVDPRQIALVMSRHPEIARSRLVVSRRDGGGDAMTFRIEPVSGSSPDVDAIEASLRDATKLGGQVVLSEPGALPNDGKVIADERDYQA